MERETTEMETNFNDESDSDDESYESASSEGLMLNERGEENEDHVEYRQFFKDLQENNWSGVEEYINRLDHQRLTAKIIVYVEETLSHIITRKLDAPIWLIEKLASQMGPQSLAESKDEFGQSAIFWAAAFGNKKAVEAFVRCNEDLPNITDSTGFLPIHEAAACGHKEVVEYLLQVTTADLYDERGFILIEDLISCGLYGIALDLLKQYPKLGRELKKGRRSILKMLANNPLAFHSGSRFGYWQRLIYRWILVQEEHISCPESVYGDEENHLEISNNIERSTHFGCICRKISTAFGGLSQKLHTMLWKVLMQASSVKHIHDTKLAHMQTLEIVKIMCNEGVIWSNKKAVKTLCEPILTAGRLVPSREVPGAAFQMQRELQWFKAVESYVHPSFRVQRNKLNKTPREVFTEEHEGLVKDGEKWMKDTAQSYTFVAALIITVVFAAAFTVPGGNNNSGIPNFSQERPFIIFIASDALALFSSTTSLLMFLGILTSRYSEEDFLMALPNKLMFGLVTMFFSIASMIVAFGATIIILSPGKLVIIPIALLCCIPVTLFALFQFPLLVEIYSSTYRSTIFKALN
ncbi:ankyrin repeat-containing protein ITN1-like isoform X2 [Pistacia vera]|uniref:ankyrin repeat-containing protein ITN1-like isoform X2 n=1 Tax=Pistacia vera TaxID=55513 RepID=UPI0012630389|nr:ankyrin repeat-containing protein ITN1-like isoform X2 [Pistacia vera]XP_031263333.1 ankyrin repeat-containing protein ITN1-like isoform X2 [Pistacia vera]